MPISQKERNRILKYVDKWRERLLLGGWGVHVKFSDEDSVTGGKPDLTYAHIEINRRYKNTRIVVFPFFLTESVGSQKETIIHELMHVHTERIREVLDLAQSHKLITGKRKLDLLEELTETMAKIVWKAYNRTKEPGEFQV